MRSIRAIVFDLYGTLLDVHSVARSCDALRPGRGAEISLLWRQKQLEYTWLRSLMGRYVPFEQATADALAFVDHQLGLALLPQERAALADAYFALEPFPEVPATLERLRARGLTLAILSNGSRLSIDAVVGNAGLRDAFDHLLSVEDVGVFKPSPQVYELAVRKIGAPREDILFVSSNAWDVAGASHDGFRTCWVNRRNSAMDELGARPTLELAGLDALPAHLSPG